MNTNLGTFFQAVLLATDLLGRRTVVARGYPINSRFEAYVSLRDKLEVDLATPRRQFGGDPWRGRSPRPRIRID